MKRKQVTNLGEAIGVLIQVAELAQKSGILSFDDAIVTKESIDLVIEMNNGPKIDESFPEGEMTEGPKGK
jgi:hypothetical protein